jgi:hypothetical protein
MNGNFERDRGSYPYAAMHMGACVRVVHIPTLTEPLPDVNLNFAAAAAVALNLNVLYYRQEPISGGNILEAFREGVDFAAAEGVLPSVSVSPIKESITEAAKQLGFE